jgi:aminoglycoside phosphotransferase (APT) family kinase protein
MDMSDAWSEADSAVTPDTVRGMVREIRPDWTVTRVERSEQGTDFVGYVDVETQTGEDRVVLKATTADCVDPSVARSEPRLFAFLGERTTIPVPDVYGYRDVHETYPAPFALVEYVPGETYEGDAFDLDEEAVRRVLRDAGANLAELHELGPLDAVGDVGVDADGDLGVLDTDSHSATTDTREWLRESAVDTLESLEDGGFFPDMADDPDRFVDLVPRLREVVHSRIDAMPAPAPPTYCHWDYRFGNLRVHPETGATNAVLDWANLTSIEPAYNLARVESHLLDSGDPDAATLAARRETFRDAYENARTTVLDPANDAEWAFTDEVRERIDCNLLLARLDAMACLPLWHRERTPVERDAVERSHRAFLADYL